jgi:hypothetical protein
MTEAASTTVATPPGQTPANPYETTPSDRWSARTQPSAPRPGAISADQYHRLDPADQAKYANLPGGQWVERSVLEAEPVDPTKPATTGDGKATVTAEGRLRVGDLDLGPEDIAGLMERSALEKLRATQIPADGAYEAKLPAELKLPGDVKFEVRADDPAFKDLKAWAQRAGLSQDQFSEALGIYAGDRARELTVLREASAKNLELLGAHANARVSAIDTWIRGVVGDELGKEMRGMIVTAKIVQGFEKIIGRHASQGVMPFRQDGREPTTPCKGPLSSMSDAEYNALSAADRFRIAKGG